MTREYELHIHSDSGEGLKFNCVLQSKLPFPAIQKGDVLNPGLWTGRYPRSAKPGLMNDAVIKITAIEHRIVRSKDDSATLYITEVVTKACPEREEIDFF
ncbi:MAG TPA: hypothetical protein VIL74_08235 [Pyrinomonadaceae bacterium]